MKTFEDYQKLGNELIKSGDKNKIKSFSEAKKTLAIRAEYNGEVYETKANGTGGIVALALDDKDIVVGTQCGETSAVADMMISLIMGLPDEIRFAVMIAVSSQEMLKRDMQ